MRITEVTFSDEVVEHIIDRHGVHPDEVNSCFFGDSRRQFKRGKGGRYLLFAQTRGGRYLCVVFELYGTTAEVVTAWAR
jgi:hypothetical protein